MTERPLCVDLDGTLCRSDTLVEALLVLLKRAPWRLLWLPLWLLRGRAAFKQRVTRAAFDAGFSVAQLPWQVELLDWLRSEAAHGRPLVLATGADAAIADAVAEHCGLFGRVFASDGHCNLTGPRKAAALVAAYGEQGFDYAGNERLDVTVWRHARAAVVAAATPRLLRAAAAVTPVVRQFAPPEGTSFSDWLKALRAHQWVKNLLVVLPLGLSHQLSTAGSMATLLAFVAFSLCASSVYLVNDLLDLPDDRQHRSKHRRPFAAGRLPLLHGLLAAPLLLAAAFAVAATINTGFMAVLAGYYLLTLAYSLALKRMPTVDVMTLAGLYTLRIIAGAAATGIAASFWLLAFSMFLFLSLSVAKRYAEMLAVKQSARLAASGRGYHVDDLPLLRSLGVSSGHAAVLLLAFYVNSPESQMLYRHPHLIWLLCPLLLYWISRVWMKTHRGLMYDDPLVFALKDDVSRAIALIGLAVLVAAAL
jgi:4-hydroxybenzoate polyprenyltransferase